MTVSAPASDGQTDSTDRPPSALVAFPAAGGGVWMFAGLRQQLSEDVELIVPDLPGRGRRARAEVSDIDQLAEQLSAELVDRIGERPYIIFGSCFGSLVSYRLIHELIRQGNRLPELFMVSARQPPDAAPGYEMYSDWSDGQFHDYLQSVWDVDPERNAAAMRLLVRQMKTDAAIGATYRHVDPEPMPVPIIAYHGVDYQWVTPAELEQWRLCTTGSFRLSLVPGGRDFYVNDASQLIADLESVLA